MGTKLKLNLLFVDRVGIVSDIAVLVAQRGLNINSMEVQRKGDLSDIYLELERAEQMPASREIMELLGGIADLIKLREIETMPHETREKRFQVVLDNMTDGVIAIDARGKITTINRVAQTALGWEEQDPVGRDIHELPLADFAILGCLKGRKSTNRKISLVIGARRLRYFATSRPIKDSSGRIVGAVEIGKDMREVRSLAQAITASGKVSFSDFVGEAPSIREVLDFAQRISKTDSVVCIRGESGTGKELIARAIHSESGRTGAFVPVNCAALPEQLLESELFGYATGAFTGARKEGKAGLFEMARGGTLFLDEIGEMPPAVQAKLLRVLQEKSVRRIGASKEVPVDTRVITATNKSLEQMVEERRFREDLYYRINVLPIHLPPLRERLEDIPLLVEHFLFQLDTRLNKTAQVLSDNALERLLGYSWPGNVRELKNVIERAAILCDSSQIGRDFILFGKDLLKGPQRAVSPLAASGLEGRSLKELVRSYERQILLEALASAKSIRAAARRLGVSHTALLNKIKLHRIGLEMEQTTGTIPCQQTLR